MLKSLVMALALVAVMTVVLLTVTKGVSWV
jgi:hypothetical protein